MIKEIKVLITFVITLIGTLLSVIAWSELVVFIKGEIAPSKGLAFLSPFVERCYDCENSRYGCITLDFPFCFTGRSELLSVILALLICGVVNQL